MKKKLLSVILLVIGLIALIGIAFGVINKASTPSRRILPYSGSISQESMSEQSSSSSIVESSTIQSESEESSQVVSSEATQDEVKRPTAQKAPDATILDTEGQTVSLLSKIGQGKPVILNIWASWCPPCRAEMPYFEAAYQKYQDQIDFVMVNAANSRPSETKDVAMQFMADNGYTMPTYFDAEFSFSNNYFVSVLPMTFLIDAEGNITKINRGGLTEAALQEGIESLLAMNE